MMKRAIIVDDDEDLAQLAAHCLQGAGFEVATARDGSEGLRLAAAFRPGLVLLDLMMPGMHGFEACRRLRAEHPGLRILVVSGKSYAADRRAAKKLGADLFLLKPWKPSELLAAVDRLLGSVDASGPAFPAGEEMPGAARA